MGGAALQEMNFDSLCDGQWASMLNLAPRVRVRPNKFFEVSYLNHTTASTTSLTSLTTTEVPAATAAPIEAETITTIINDD